MKFAIIDDEKKATDLIETYITEFVTENHFEIQTRVFNNPVEFLESYTKDYDLVFLDVEMPGLNGIETAKELRHMDSNVVIMFITNMAQYAIHGYEVEAVDYVLKPLSYADFAMKVQKALRYIARNEDANVKLCTKDGMIHLSVSDIYYIEVRSHYLIYHRSDERDGGAVCKISFCKMQSWLSDQSEIRAVRQRKYRDSCGRGDYLKSK